MKRMVIKLSKAVVVTMFLFVLAPRAGMAQTERPGQLFAPLANVLNPDGTLNLNDGIRGSLDSSGWRMTAGPGGALRAGEP